MWQSILRLDPADKTKGQEDYFTDENPKDTVPVKI